MGCFYKGVYYSTTTNIGPNERYGIEDEMSFYNFAQDLEKSREERNNELNINQVSEENSKNKQFTSDKQKEKSQPQKITPDEQKYIECINSLKKDRE